MTHIFRILILLLLPIIAKGIWEILHRRNHPANGVVFRSNISAFLSMSSATVFIIIAFCCTLSTSLTATIFAAINFIIALLCLLPTIAFINCCIYYNDDEFIVKSFFGIKKHYTYDMVTSIAHKDDSYSMRDTLIYVDDRKVKVTEISNGGKQFISYVKKKYSALNNGQCIREISKTKRDIFYNGNITSPILHMSLQIFVCIFVFGFTVLVFFISPVQFTADDTIEQQVSFSSYRIWFNDLMLHSTDGNTYMLHISSLPSNIEKIKELCNGTDILTVYSTKNTPKRGLVYDYWIRELSYDGNQLLTFEDDYRFNHRIWIYLVILAVISSLTVVTHFVGSIFVGRHPERYSKRIRRLFFRSWAWRKSNIIHKK